MGRTPATSCPSTSLAPPSSTRCQHPVQSARFRTPGLCRRENLAGAKDWFGLLFTNHGVVRDVCCVPENTAGDARPDATFCKCEFGMCWARPQGRFQEPDRSSQIHAAEGARRLSSAGRSSDSLGRGRADAGARALWTRRRTGMSALLAPCPTYSRPCT